MRNIINRYSVVILLIVFTAVSLWLRLNKIEQVFTTLNRDEAALAYNAYLLKTTGQDEWGQHLSTTLLSFGDWKLIGYPFLLIILFQVLPLADWVVRLPSILAGTALIPLTYFIIFGMTKNKLNSILAALFIATTPIFFFYSRMAYEANVALTLVVAAVYLLYFYHQNKYVLIKYLLAGLLLLYAGLTYNTPIFLVPLITLTLIINQGIFRYQAWNKPVLILVLVFLSIFGLTQTVLFNKTGITIFSNAAITQARNESYSNFSLPGRTVLANQYVFYGKMITLNLVKSFSPIFLVTTGGDNPWHQLPGWGHISPISYLLMILAIIVVIVQFKPRKSITLLFKTGIGPQAALIILAILSLIPSAMTVDTPHATRSLLFIYLMVVLAFSALPFSKVSKNIVGKISLVILLLGQIFYFGRYLNAYFNLYDQKIDGLKPGFIQAVRKLNLNQQEKVAIEDEDGYQYILLAWYLKIPADYYLANNQRGLASQYGLRYGERVGQYHFIADKRDQNPSETHLVWFSKQTKTWQVE